jgi:sodium-dependent dicarboxylate transporter 2/3/5
MSRQSIGLWLGPVAALSVFIFFNPDSGNPATGPMAAVVALMVIWWISEAVPLAVTALLPFVLFPLFGIMPGGAVAASYMNPLVFLLIGGFLIALALERWEVHRRIALRLLLIMGRRPETIILGFMLVCAFLSAWISNTATAVTMLPVALALIVDLEKRWGREAVAPFAVALLLSVAYACSIGGISTLVGTATNIALKGIYEASFPEAAPLLFGQWTAFALPLSLILLAVTWVLITRVFFRFPKNLILNKEVLQQQAAALGKLKAEEWRVAAVFALTATLWMFRGDLVLGDFVLPGWSRLHPSLTAVNDGMIAVFGAILLFVLPARRTETGEPQRLLETAILGRVPWGMVLLFGGGFALAAGFRESGLSAWMGESFLSGLSTWPVFALVLAICLLMTKLTELTSNAASVQLILPVLAGVAVAQGVSPLLLMIPASLAASMAFMLPIATPPNTVVFATERIPMLEMVRCGFWLNLVSALILAVYIQVAAPWFFSL